MHKRLYCVQPNQIVVIHISNTNAHVLESDIVLNPDNVSA